jgi:hypothetical protein
LRCSRCRCMYYCSRECQTADWRRHKKECAQEKQAHERYQAEKQGAAK